MCSGKGRDDSTKAKLALLLVKADDGEEKRMNVSGVRLHTLAREILERTADKYSPLRATSLADSPTRGALACTMQQAFICGAKWATTPEVLTLVKHCFYPESDALVTPCTLSSGIFKRRLTCLLSPVPIDDQHR